MSALKPTSHCHQETYVKGLRCEGPIRGAELDRIFAERGELEHDVGARACWKLVLARLAPPASSTKSGTEHVHADSETTRLTAS
jgi:hypothetical protein